MVNEFTASTYGDRIAGVYDSIYRATDPTDCVDLLAELSSGGRVLELGIGTGRDRDPISCQRR